MQIVIKKQTKNNKNLKLYQGIKHMTLVRIYPKTRIKSNVSEVKVKISLKTFKTPKPNDLYTMKVYFSPSLVNELGWTKGSNIAVSKDDKDINNFVFSLADDNRGFRIYNTKNIYYIQFPIDTVVIKYNEINTAKHELVDGDLKVVL